jgi:RES domain-containing protein
VRIFRIADGRHPVWDGTGAALVGGRWNSPGRVMIYGSLSYACALLEVLAHAGIGRVPTTHCVVIAEVPDGLLVERAQADALMAGWDAENSASARAFGDQWIEEARSAVLLVPSVVARLEWNVLVNPAHPDASKLLPSRPEKVLWDKRLFERKPDSV